jgi:hypothetical protein
MSKDNKATFGQGFWKEHDEAWKSSGLTQVAYCAEQGISYQSFVYQHQRMANKAKRASAKFIEAKQTSVGINGQVAGLQLMLPNGVRIGITSELNTSLLNTVLTIAGGLSC